jgi:hypothetical protein
VWRERYGLINEFERNLTRNGIAVLEFFLHISKDKRKRRLESRLADPDKRWRFFKNDFKERAVWDDYQAAFEDAVNECSTSYRPLVRRARQQAVVPRPKTSPAPSPTPSKPWTRGLPGPTGFGERHDTGLAPGFLVRMAAAASGLGYDVPGP